MTTGFEPHWVQQSSRRVERVHRATTIEQVLALVRDMPDARVVAGGTDLVVELSRTFGPPLDLIDLSEIAGFRSIDRDADSGVFRLAGGVTHNDVLRRPDVVAAALPLAQACLEIGSPQLRNRATIAGNLVTASPANDSISALMALDAAIELSRLEGDTRVSRQVRVADFFPGFRQTDLRADELITAILVPGLEAAQRAVWVKLGLRRAQAISVVHAAVWVEFDPRDPSLVRDARVALGSVAPTVVLSGDSQNALIGSALDDDAIEAAATAARAGVAPIDDGRATADYRSSAVATVVRRALRSIADDVAASTWPDRLPTLGQPVDPAPAGSDPRPARTIDDRSIVRVAINGNEIDAAGAASVTLLDWLRDHAGTGTKEGCAEGECGACTVILDGDAVMSCLVPAAQADGGSVTTVEGLASPDSLSDVQQAFVDHFAVQCGYCIPGFIVASTALGQELDAPTRAETELGLAGNLCRCTGYYPILQAVEAVFADRTRP